jgi:hypothetical protein
MANHGFPKMPDHVVPYYECYRDLGPERNIHKVFKAMGQRPTYTTITKWSRKYQWDARLIDDLGDLAIGGEVIPEFDVASMNRKTLQTIDDAIREVGKRKEKTEKDASAMLKLTELRAKVAERVDEIEQQDRIKLIRAYATNLRDALEEEYRGAADLAETEG